MSFSGNVNFSGFNFKAIPIITPSIPHGYTMDVIEDQSIEVIKEESEKDEDEVEESKLLNVTFSHEA